MNTPTTISHWLAPVPPQDPQDVLLAEMLAVAGLPPVQISAEDRRMAAQIEARGLFEQGKVGEAYQVLRKQLP